MNAHRAPLSVGLVLVAAACGSAEGTRDRRSAPAAATSADLLPAHHYRLELEDGVAAMSAWMPPGDSPTRVDLPDLSGRDVRRAQIEDVRCDDQPLASDGAGWLAPAGCRVLRWHVRFATPPPGGVDPAARRAVWDPERRWWLLPGAAAFLAPEGGRERGSVDIRVPEGTSIFHHLPPSDRLGHELPAPARLGRLLIGFGDFVEHTRGDGATTYRHLFDREPEREPAALQATHARASAYLAQVFGGGGPRAIDVFWFGRDRAQRAVTGAAGIDAVASAYIRGELPEEAPAHARHADLLVLLHEQIHLLEGPQLPEWVSESLAHYYALKALRHTGVLPAEELDGFVESLGQADRDYLRRVVLWRDLDRALADATDGSGSLDGLVAEIQRLVFLDGGVPPQRFLVLLREAGLESPEEVTRPHLGWPEAEPEDDEGEGEEGEGE